MRLVDPMPAGAFECAEAVLLTFDAQPAELGCAAVAWLGAVHSRAHPLGGGGTYTWSSQLLEAVPRVLRACVARANYEEAKVALDCLYDVAVGTVKADGFTAFDEETAATILRAVATAGARSDCLCHGESAWRLVAVLLRERSEHALDALLGADGADGVAALLKTVQARGGGDVATLASIAAALCCRRPQVGAESAALLRELREYVAEVARRDATVTEEAAGDLARIAACLASESRRT
jgi:hypothetical protein